MIGNNRELLFLVLRERKNVVYLGFIFKDGDRSVVVFFSKLNVSFIII